MELTPWYIYQDIYEPHWDSDTQKIVWEEGSTTVIYLSSFIKTAKEAQELLERSYTSEIALPNCPWHVRDW